MRLLTALLVILICSKIRTRSEKDDIIEREDEEWFDMMEILDILEDK